MRVAVRLAALLLLTGCAGGSSGTPVAPTSPNLHGLFVIRVPGRSVQAHKRRPSYVSPSAVSASIAVTGIAQPVIADISASSPACTTAGNLRSCKVTVTAPPGNDTFTVTTYDGPNATGNVLSTGTTTQMVSGNGFSVSVATSGQVASIQLVLTPPVTTFKIGAAATSTLTANALDAGNNVIVGSYENPIAVTNADKSGTFALSGTSLAASGQSLSLKYSGAPTPRTDTITSSSHGVTNAGRISVNVANSPALYIGTFTGVKVYSLSGTLLQTFATSTSVENVSLDDAGNVYVASTGTPPTIARYAIGASQPSATYQPSPGISGSLLSPSHKGELVSIGTTASNGLIFDVWDVGKTGAPSRTFRYPTASFAWGLDNDGTLYVPYHDATTQTFRYDVIPAGASQPSRTIVDTIVAGSNAASFDAFSMVAQSNGTLYVGEWDFLVGDPQAGLYVYPKGGQERLVTTGATAPTALSMDAAANVYVLNSNFAFGASGAGVCDTLHTLSTFSPGARTLLSQATTGFTNGQGLTVAANGQAYISEFAYTASVQTCPEPQGRGAVATVASGATSGSTLIPNIANQWVALYDGVHATNVQSQALP